MAQKPTLNDQAPTGPNRGSPVAHDPPAPPTSYKILMLAAVVVPFAAVVTVIVMLWTRGWMGWFYLNMVLIGWLLTGTGITVGYHRLLTHKSFETYGWMRAYWMIMGALAAQESPVQWCSVHRLHHAVSDRAGDPHSPHQGGGWWNAMKGFWYSHTGWLFTGHLLYTDQQRYTPDLVNDRLAAWIHRHYIHGWIPLSLIIPAVIGGAVKGTWAGVWLGLLWGGFVRIFLVHHITWSINSVCHMFGTRDYDVRDESRNHLLFGLLGFGEGWHNNHHAFPSSARHGLKWWQLDPSWIIIRSMQAVGLAWNVQLPSKEAIVNRRIA
jgi:stearoyl-CoA desaturase (delta-9 desaturase)